MIGLFFAKREIAKNAAFAIRRMVHAVHYRHVGEIKRRHVFKTGHVHAVFIWVRATLMERVNPADRAEEMPRRPRVEPVLRQLILTSGHGDTRQRCRDHNRGPHTAKRAAAAPRGIQAVSQFDGKGHRTTVALCMTNVSHWLYPFSYQFGSFEKNLIFYTIAFLPAQPDKFVDNAVTIDRFLR